MKICFTAFTFFAFLAGCSEGAKPELNLVIPSNLPVEAKSLVETSWPKVKAACPGLSAHASKIDLQTIEENFSYASSKEAERVSIVFKVKDSPSLVFGKYVANGHSCFFEVSRDGSQLSVPKSPCASLCEDKAIDASEYKKAI
ncbi:MAG: hypothetical protein DCE87_06920 [Betaproteobacteria bacterium]|jgi:hypothetical protein|nr:MAG: hypothetical protein DCE87_06920 [Betaproteobacteria bacterium]PZO20202.1 MAG: hypothetical protein DCE89_15710 [Betaproteobacteria bacterium]PZO26845.1 MAG: hypothetical protein DCE88_11415 [Betaproteobacteria bacterium]